jgi:hypothetical protein
VGVNLRLIVPTHSDLTPHIISLNSFDDVDESIEELVRKIAAQTPLTTAATWLNWIIVRATVSFKLVRTPFHLPIIRLC